MPGTRAAIVTGASSGIGLAIARVLAEEGFSITMAARRADKLEAAVKGLADEGFDVHAVAANLGEEAEVQKVVAAHRERYGRLDVLVNAEAHPAHEIFGVEDSDDVFGAALRIVDGDAGVLLVDDAGQGIVEVEVGGQGKNSGARDHDLAGGDVVEFERVEEHFS